MYSVLYADPPWRYRVYNARSGPVTKGRAGQRGIAERHYQSLSLAALHQMAIGAQGAPNSALFLWATAPCLSEAHLLMKLWGYTYKTIAFVWIKTNQDGVTVTGRLGHYTRSATEFVLLGTRGKLPRRDTRVEQVVLAPRGAHSAKPEEVARRIMRLYDGPYAEFFARQRRPGWDCFGDQLPEVLPTS